MTGTSHDVDWNLSSEILCSFHHSLCVHSDAVAMILLLSCSATNGKQQQAGNERLGDLLPWCRGCSWKGDCLNLKSEHTNKQKLLFSDLWGFICIHNCSCMFTKLCLLRKKKRKCIKWKVMKNLECTIVVERNWSLYKKQIRKIPWSRKWQPTPVYLPGKSQGDKSLVESQKSHTQLGN